MKRRQSNIGEGGNMSNSKSKNKYRISFWVVRRPKNSERKSGNLDRQSEVILKDLVIRGYVKG